MEKDTIEVATSVPFDFWSALIAAGFGLVSGTVASLIAPWIHWFIEKRKKSLELKAQRLSDIRALLDSSKSIDEIKKSSLWGFIESNLSDNEKQFLSPTIIPAKARGSSLTEDDFRKQAISTMVSRLEEEWFR